MGIINAIVQLWWLWLTAAAISGIYVIRYYYKQFQEAKKIMGKRGSFNFEEANEKAWEGLWGAIIMMLVLMASMVLLLICAAVGILRAA